ncbi:ImmA/IrrE family metallo-endopeptidase [Rhodovulum steppense]|nr:ImmA/IrrE family metallo-endopeptidase [Rhodovulum steppense]
MQLREYLPYDVREAMRALPADGELRHKVRNFTLNPRVDGRARSVKAFAEDLGFAIVERRLPRGMNGRLARDPWSENGFVIEVNSSLSIEAKRFTVLHEIAHYFLHTEHRDPLGWDEHFDPTGQTFYVDTQAEREANAFAEALLFGGGQLAAAHGLLGGDIKKLAKYFGVTEPVVRIALSKLQEN